MATHPIFLVSPFCEMEYQAEQSTLNYLRYYLRDNSPYDAEIVDCARYDREYDQVIEEFKVGTRPIIGITGYSRERFHAYRLIRRIRREIPDAVIVVGGRHFGFLATDTLTKLPDVDIVCREEGEVPFKMIVEAVHEEKSWGHIPGISFRKENGELVHVPALPTEKNLDKFRNFDREVYAAKKDGRIFNSKVDKENRYFSVMASRGCPYKCVFCSLTSETLRLRTPSKVLDEIEEKMALTGSHYLRFADSSFTLKNQFVEDICRGMIQRKLDLKWGCYSRVNIRPDLLNLMREAGLVSVEIALESGSPKVLKAMQKAIKPELYEIYVKRCHELGIRAHVFTVCSLPEETVEDVDMTLNLLRKTAPYIYQSSMQVTRILPDAALWKIAIAKGKFPREFSWFDDYRNDAKILLKQSDYETLPLFFDLMTEEQIAKKVAEFNDLCRSRFSYSSNLWRDIRENLRLSNLLAIKPEDLPGKFQRLATRAMGAIRNWNKARQFAIPTAQS